MTNTKKRADFLEANKLVRKALKLLYRHAKHPSDDDHTEGDRDLELTIGHIQSGIDSFHVPER